MDPTNRDISGLHCTRKEVLYIETGHWFSVGAMYVVDIMVKMNMVKMATFKNIFEGSQEI